LSNRLSQVAVSGLAVRYSGFHVARGRQIVPLVVVLVPTMTGDKQMPGEAKKNAGQMVLSDVSYWDGYHYEPQIGAYRHSKFRNP